MPNFGEFGILLRTYMARKNITAAKLAELIGTSSEQMSRNMSGKSRPRKKRLLTIANVLELSGSETLELMITVGYDIDASPSQVDGLLSYLDRTEAKIQIAMDALGDSLDALEKVRTAILGSGSSKVDTI